MREIKFRAWDKTEKMFRTMSDSVYKNDYVTFQENTLRSEYEDIVLMQYTGLKDKNGKEIYEGDIVQQYQTSEIADVKFPQMFHLIGENVEVVGNIYENPELINNNNK